MTRTFLFVALQSFKNRLLYRLKRFKEIRYLLGAILGGAYFFFIFTRGGTSRGLSRLTPDFAAVLALFGLILPWILTNLSSLAFSEAELHFVIGGPVSRRRVLLYKLIQSQPQVLIAVVVSAFIRIPNGKFIGFWIVYCVYAVYNTFVAIVRQWLNERGIATLWIAIVAMAAFCGAGWIIFQFAFPAPAQWHDPRLTPLLFLPRIFVAPLFATAPLAIAIAGLKAAALGAVLFFLAATIRVQFDDLVQTASERVTQFRARMARQPGTEVAFRRLRAPFRLREGAAPEMAILWKNLTAIMRMAFSGILLIFVLSGLFLGGALLSQYAELKSMCAGFAIGTAVLFPLFGSMIFKQDYRLEITRADVMKTWPLAGERLFAAEIAAPLLMISALQIVLIVNAAVTCLIAGGEMTKFATPQLLVIVLLFAVPICAMQICLRNAVAVVFPGWGFRSREEQRGFIALGQNILMMIINLVSLSLFLAPAAIVSVLGLWLASRFGSDNAALLAAATMPAVLLLCAEVWLVIKMLGTQIDKLDVGKDLEPSAI